MQDRSEYLCLCLAGFFSFYILGLNQPKFIIYGLECKGRLRIEFNNENIKINKKTLQIGGKVRMGGIEVQHWELTSIPDVIWLKTVLARNAFSFAGLVWIEEVPPDILASVPVPSCRLQKKIDT